MIFRTLVILFMMMLSFSSAARAETLCAAGNDKLFASGPGAATAAWTQDDLAHHRVSDTCADLAGKGFGFYAAVSGRFNAGGAEAALKRFASISSLQGLPYWSETDKRNETLIRKAAALDGPGGAPRADFTVAELRSGKDLYFSQVDNRSSRPVEYRMAARVQKSGKIIISITNVSAVYWSVLPVFKPQALQSVYILQPLGDGSYGYFNLSAVRGGLGIASSSQQKSTLNRAVAMYTHFTARE